MSKIVGGGTGGWETREIGGRRGEGGKWEFLKGGKHLLNIKILSKTRTKNVF